MRYHVLACDYDGTIAHHGKVGPHILAALERLRGTGRRLILVTGRELDELLEIFPEIDLFDRVVAENGALIYHPGSKETNLLAEAPPAAFVEELRRRGVAPISVGHSIVATWQPHQSSVLDVIREQGLELQVIFNKDAVMVLPAGVNKASGLKVALSQMNLSPHEVVGVGDAENDHAFLALGECAVAVANALPALQERADWVTPGDHGTGVVQLIDRLVADDLTSLEDRLSRHHLLLGHDSANEEVRLPSYGVNLLIAGPSGSGKSTSATALLERLADHSYQFCIIDPEGDYEGLEGAVVLGGGNRPPTADEVVRLLEDAGQNVVVNLIGLPLSDRPAFFLTLLPRLTEMRARTGRPHWLVVDEAHHLLPAAWAPGPLGFPADVSRTAFITVHPDKVAASALATVNTLIAVGESPDQTIASFCKVVGGECPSKVPTTLETGRVLLWSRDTGRTCEVRVAPAQAVRHRHIRKYAEGELPPERSFYFRGPEDKLNLRAQNLILFMQLADGVDDETWLFHLRKGDYSDWFRTRIKDDELAEAGAAIEGQAGTMSAAESRAAIKEAIGQRYTLPASGPLPMPGTDGAPKRQEGA